MKLYYAFSSLLALTDARQRVTAAGLVLLLFVSGAFEMGGMLILFSYMTGLAHAQTIAQTQSLRGILETSFGQMTEMEFAIFGGAIVILTFVLKNVLATGVEFANSRFLMKIYTRIAPKLFDAFLNVPLKRFQRHGSGEPVRILGQMLPLFNASLGSAMLFLSDLIMVGMIASLLIWVDPFLALLASSVFGLALLTVQVANRTVVEQMGSEALAAQRSSARLLNESFGGLIYVKLKDAVATFVEPYQRLINRTALLNRRRRALSQLPRMSNEILLSAGIVATVLYYGLNGQPIESVVPTLALFGLAGLRLTSALSRLTTSLQLTSEKHAELKATMDVIGDLLLDTEKHHAIPNEKYSTRDLPLPPGAPNKFSKSLIVDGVHFKYPGSVRPTLERADITITPDTFVGLCGSSGSGKSTLLLIMTGLIVPDGGDVTCDGWSVFDHAKAWHSRIGYVGQHCFVAPRSVLENVAYGKPVEEIDEEKVWHTLELVQLADVVRQLPRRLETGLGGGRLSGGQSQRLEIARALYSSPEILFLDEATAALDSATERKLLNSVRASSETKTVICAAHRMSTIHDADVIHFLEHGSIVASDAFDRLIQSNTEFSTFVSAADRQQLAEHA